MNKQNFTSKFSNILGEEEQNQSREMNGGETKTFGDRKGARAAGSVLRRMRNQFPSNPIPQRTHSALKQTTK